MIDSFVLYKEYSEYFDMLTDEQAGVLIKLIMKYANGEDVEISDSLVKMAFTFIKNQIDRDHEKYDEIKKKRSSCGQKGGRPKTEENQKKQMVFDENQKKQMVFDENQKNQMVFDENQKNQMVFDEKQKKHNDTVTVTDTVTDTVIKESEKEKADKSATFSRKKYGEYKNVLLTDAEYEKLKTEFPNDFEERIENVSTYCASSGRIYKNYLAVIRKWAKQDTPKQDTGQKYLYKDDFGNIESLTRGG